MANINLKLPDDLRRLFKSACAERDVNMTQQIIYLITRDIEQHTKAKKVK